MGDDYTPRNSIFGLVTGSGQGVQFPDQPCYMFRIKAGESNAGTFLLGNSPGTCRYPLGAGDDTGWAVAENLNSMAYNGTSGTNYLYWWVQR